METERKATQRALLELVVNERWTYYVAVVRQRMNSRILQRESSSEILQSALRTVVRRIELGETRLTERPQMEALLLTVLLRRCANKAARHAADRRSYLGDQPIELALGLLSREPKPWLRVQAMEIADRLEALPAELRAATELDLEGFTNEEIANRLNISRATVTRRLRDAQRLLSLSMGYCAKNTCGATTDRTTDQCDICGTTWTRDELDQAVRMAREAAAKT
jgi:DNA-directed RNA polymerase specialized sigma24 family protein